MSAQMLVPSQTTAPPSLMAWRIDPLPDFLTDPRLTGDSETQRLEEHTAGWVQMLAGLSAWRDQASFALHYMADGRQVKVFMVALARDRAAGGRLRAELTVLLRAGKLIPDPARAVVAKADFQAEVTLRDERLVRVRQHYTDNFWQVRGANMADATGGNLFGIPASLLENPPLVFPWAGPSGPFLVPLESLLSQPVPCSITILLQPTALRPWEQKWLALISQCAQTAAEQNLQVGRSGIPLRLADPAASLAARLYGDSLSRLTAAPFLCTAFCAAEGREDVAISLAGALRSLVHPPLTKRQGEDEQPLPCGADMIELSAGGHPLAEPFQRLRFADVPEGSLERLPDLMDARGAATFFRLPVSVRGGVPGVRVRQSPPDFHPGPRLPSRDGRLFPDQMPAQNAKDADGRIELGFFHAGGCASTELSWLTRHTLVTGFTGSGKTVTVFQILHQAWANNIPFLVLESAKREYRGLTKVERLQAIQPNIRVYTPGNELLAPFRLNPFQLLPGMRVESHISRLQVCFEAAIPPLGPSSSVITEALHRSYEECGWMLTEEFPRSGICRRRVPTLSDFVAQVEQVLEDRDYQGEVRSNLMAALVGRFRPLLLGGKGRTFNTPAASPDLDTLFNTPVILELNDLHLDDQALLVLFVLTFLREYRDLHPAPPGQLVHLTVVEEAHNVLSETQSAGSGEGATQADTRYKAVQAFCSMLSEVRALGEGLVISDQSPQKLARDAIRNTNLQIAHQLRDADDRHAIARAMIMEDEQQEFLGKQATGQAALFYTGLEKATFVTVSPYTPPRPPNAPPPSPAEEQAWRAQYRGYGYDPRMDDEELRRYMDRTDAGLPKRRKLCLPFAACDVCPFGTVPHRCLRDVMYPHTAHPAIEPDAMRWFYDMCLPLNAAEGHGNDGLDRKAIWREGVTLAARLLHEAKAPLSQESLWCALAHLWGRRLRKANFTEAEEGLTAQQRDVIARDWDEWQQIWRSVAP